MARGIPRNVVEGSEAGAPVSIRGRRSQRGDARRVSSSGRSSSAPPSTYARASGGSVRRASITASSRTTKGGGSGAGAFIEPCLGGLAGGGTDLVEERLFFAVALEVLDEQVDDAAVAREPAGRRMGSEHDTRMIPERAFGRQRRRRGTLRDRPFPA